MKLSIPDIFIIKQARQLTDTGDEVTKNPPTLKMKANVNRSKKGNHTVVPTNEGKTTVMKPG